MTTILIAALVLGGLGLIFGLLLTLANKVFEVPSDPRRDAVRNCLPGANCGGCGYAGCDALAEPDEAVDAGKLIIVPGREGYRLGRAVNSLTTLTPDKAAPFQKIKIVEGIDLIRGDIAKAFESGYVGKVLNDYDNKLLLVTAINAYLKGLEGDVLDKTADNRCFVSLSGQRSYLESRGTDTSDMKDTDILKANTGSQVFLEAKLTFCDAMEDLALVISM